MTVDEACRTYRISRTKFYRMLRDSSNGLEAVIVRIPPVVGPIRIPPLDFEQWLRR